MTGRAWTCAATLLVAVALLGGCAEPGRPANSAGGPAEPDRWHPLPGLRWQIQLDGAFDPTVAADVYELDGELTPADQVADLKAAGHHTVCYLNAGGWEPYRTDSQAFPPQVRGNVMVGWPDEQWLDVRRRDVLLPIMAARMDECARKGFDAVDPDNIHGYTENPGFPLTEADSVAYVRDLADLAHERGLAFGLKNGLGLVDEVADVTDFAVNEQCFQYAECGAYDGLLAAGIPVFVIEYDTDPAVVCPRVPPGMSIVFKPLALGPERHECPTR